MKLRIFLTIAIFYILGILTTKGQEVIPAEAKQALRQLQQQYNQVKLLGLHVAYRYTNEHDSKTILDSLSGDAVLQGTDYYYAIGNTKTVKSGVYSILLFSEDKLMYLAKNKQQDASPVAIASGLDSLMQQVSGVKVSFTQSAVTKTITVLFPADYAYKRMQLVIDKHTGYMLSCSYTLKTEQLTDTGMLDDAAKKRFEPYATVTAKYTYYAPGKEQALLFDTAHFFTRNAAGELMPASSYSDYTIYKATPNL